MNAIYQIYYNDETAKLLDPLCTPVFNETLTDYYENDVMIALELRDAFKEFDYVGVLSPRFKEKTGRTLQEIYAMMYSNPSDIYVLCAYDHEVCKQFWAKTFKDSIILQDCINEAGFLPFKIDQSTWVNAYCNYVICRGAIMSEYVNTVLMPVKHYLMTTKDPRVIAALDRNVTHRGGTTSIIPYFFEGLFGAFIGNSTHKHEILITPKPVFV